MAPRPKQEYEERDADEDGTPLERFKKLAARVVTTPKEEIGRRASGEERPISPKSR